MLRISGVTVPESKRLAIGLTSIYGVGRPRALSTLSALGIDAGKRPKDLSAKEETALREAVEKFTLEGELKRQISGNIRRLKDIKSYRGSRHAKHLPVRGQRPQNYDIRSAQAGEDIIYGKKAHHQEIRKQHGCGTQIPLSRTSCKKEHRGWNPAYSCDLQQHESPACRQRGQHRRVVFFRSARFLRRKERYSVRGREGRRTCRRESKYHRSQRSRRDNSRGRGGERISIASFCGERNRCYAHCR